MYLFNGSAHDPPAQLFRAGGVHVSCWQILFSSNFSKWKMESCPLLSGVCLRSTLAGGYYACNSWHGADNTIKNMD